MSWILFLLLILVIGIAWGILSSRISGWNRSLAGNETRIIAGSRVTIYPSGNGWKYCIADRSDRDPPYYSDTFDTEEAAKHEALAFINGYGSKFQSKREQRHSRIRSQSSDLVDSESRRLEKIEQSLGKTTSKAIPKMKTLNDLREMAKKRASLAITLKTN